MKFRINCNIKYWDEMMRINDQHRKISGRRLYFINPYNDKFQNMYFKDDRVAVPSKCFIFRYL